MNTQDLLDIGFTQLPHYTVCNFLNYDLGRNRQLSVGNVGTPNEILFISEIASDKKEITDTICLHNYDYDGYLTIEKIKSIIGLIEK